MGNGQAQVFDAAAFTAWVAGTAQALPPSFCGVTQDTRRLTAEIGRASCRERV